MNKIVILTLLVIYAASVNENIANYIKELFNNSIFRLVAIICIIYVIQYSIQIAILLSICFVLTIHYINNDKINELRKKLSV